MTAVIFQIDWGQYVPDLLRGTLRTLELTAVSFAGASLIGLVCALVRLSRTPFRYVALIYTEMFKNIPTLVPIFIVYYGLASSGLVLNTFVAGCLSLALFYGSYLAEIFRGGLQGVSPDQREAAQASGLSRRSTLFHVILPQAFRLALPGTSTMLVDLLKGTSLLVTISAGELFTQGTLITASTFRALEVYVVIGGIYFCLCYPLSQLMLQIERLLARGVPIAPSRRIMWKLIRRSLTVQWPDPS
jgi:polar amino acid transport system permease protein